ncbi:MAG: hypothetical protein FJ090_03860 [Deltaproteobacteria bacterium]|nr:hypothetical protein [Deltaproteobacteria bacterium]
MNLSRVRFTVAALTLAMTTLSCSTGSEPDKSRYGPSGSDVEIVKGPAIEDFSGKHKMWVSVFDEGSLLYECAFWDRVTDGTADCSRLVGSGANVVGLPITTAVYTHPNHEKYATAEVQGGNDNLERYRVTLNHLHDEGFYVFIMIDTIFVADETGDRTSDSAAVSEAMATSETYRESILEIVLVLAEMAEEHEAMGFSPVTEPEKTFGTVALANDFYRYEDSSGDSVLDRVRGVYSYGNLVQISKAQSFSSSVEEGSYPLLEGFDMVGVNYSPEGDKVSPSDSEAAMNAHLDGFEDKCAEEPGVGCFINQVGVWGAAAAESSPWMADQQYIEAYQAGIDAALARPWLVGWGPFDGTDNAPLAVGNDADLYEVIRSFFADYRPE